MGILRVVKIAFRISSYFLSSKEKNLTHLSSKNNLKGRILFTLRDYLMKQSQTFDDVKFQFTDKKSFMLPNGTCTGILGEINRSEVDIGFPAIIMKHVVREVVDFSYPYEFFYSTFMIQQPEYRPEVFGIFRTFSLPIWIAIISVFIAMMLVYYLIFKSKYTLDKISLDVLAVFLRQSTITKPSTLSEYLVMYVWVFGAMFICLAYDSVFLSFMAFLPVIQIRDLSDLVKVVQNGEYHCFTVPNSRTHSLLLKSEQEDLRKIATDIKNNNIRFEDVFEDFFSDKRKLNLAFILDGESVDRVNVRKKLVSQNRFLENLAALVVRKDFCCKNLLESFVHRLLASGLYLKFQNDRAFLIRMPLLFHYLDEKNSERTLTLTDVTPAFIILLLGYFISFLVFLKEVICDKNKKKK